MITDYCLYRIDKNQRLPPFLTQTNLKVFYTLLIWNSSDCYFPRCIRTATNFRKEPKCCGQFRFSYVNGLVLQELRKIVLHAQTRLSGLRLLFGLVFGADHFWTHTWGMLRSNIHVGGVFVTNGINAAVLTVQLKSVP